MQSDQKDFVAPESVNEPPTPESPCIKVCVLDPVAKVCLGCYRTIEEITGWSGYPDQEKWAIRSALPARRTRYNPDVASRGEKIRSSSQTKRCGQCDAEFVCDVKTPGVQCWCASLPHISPPLGSSKACLCPNCLAKAIQQA